MAAYRVMKISPRGRSGRPIISLNCGSINRMTIFNDTYNLMKDRLPSKKDFNGVQILIDDQNRKKFVVRPIFSPTPNAAMNVVMFKRKKDRTIRFGCTDLFDHIGLKRNGSIRLVGRWVSVLGPGALEFDVRKPQ